MLCNTIWVVPLSVDILFKNLSFFVGMDLFVLQVSSRFIIEVVKKKRLPDVDIILISFLF